MAIIPTKVLIGWETVFGETPASPTPYPLNVKTFGLTHTRDSEEDKTMGGAIDSGGGKITTGSTNTGDFESTAYWEQVGVYLKAIMGNPTTVDNTDGTFTHTFDTTQDTIPSMYAEVTSGASALVEVFNGVMAGKFDTSFSGKGIPTIKLSTLAKSHLDSIKDAYTPIVDTGAINLGKTSMNMIYTYAKIGGADYCKLSDFSITIDRLTEAEDLLCNNKDIYILGADVMGSLSSVFDAALYASIASEASTPMEVGYEVGTGATLRKLAFIIDEAEFTFKTEPKAVGTKVVVNSDWSAVRSAGGTQKLKVVLTNTIAAY